jgi:hypothetical protein
MSVKGGVGLSFAFFRKIFPTKELKTLSASEIEALGKVYAKWELIALPFVLGYAAASGYLSYLLLSYLGDLAARSHSDYVYLVVPDREFWGVPAVFLGILFSGGLTHFTFKVLLGDRYDQYTLWTNLRHGFDGWKAFRLLAILMVFGSILLVAGGLLTWDEFHEDRLVMRRPWKWNAQTHLYSQVKAIAFVARSKAPNGNIGVSPHYAIRFDDGLTWETGVIKNPEDSKRDIGIVTLITQRSGRPIQKLDFIDEWKP